MRTVTAISVIVFLGALLILVAPIYDQSISQTSVYEVATTNYQTLTVYSLPAPVTFPVPNSGVNSWTSTFNLEAGSNYTIHIIQCQLCTVLLLYVPWPTSPSISVTTNWEGSGNATFVAPNTGSYELQLGTLNYPASGTISSVTITTVEPQSEVTETASSTTTGIVAVPPYTILGILPTALILIGLATILLILNLLRAGKSAPR